MFRFAIGNLLSRSLRSFLAFTGLAIAIAGMVALFSIAQGINHVVNRTFAQIPGLAVQQRGAPVPLFSTLPAAWRQDLEAIPGVAVVDSEIVQRLNIMEGKALISPPRFLVGFDLDARRHLQRDVYRENLTSGRYFTPEDVGTNHCLISQQVAVETGRGVGDTLALNEDVAEIIGIYETGSMLLDVNILVDLNYARKLMRISPDTVSFFYVEAVPGADQRALKAQIEKLFIDRSLYASASDDPSAQGWIKLGQRALNAFQQAAISASVESQLPPLPGSSTSTSEPSSSATSPEKPSGQKNTKVSPVEVRLAEDWAARFSEFTGDLELFLMLITVMAVSIAVLSIVNTMTMSVSERMIEFGILRANGWSKMNIIQLMTLESSILGFLGGLFGASLGLAITLIVNNIWSDRVQLYASGELLVFAVFISTLLGVIGGLYPAWIAASRSPMDAIRRG